MTIVKGIPYEKDMTLLLYTFSEISYTAVKYINALQLRSTTLQIDMTTGTESERILILLAAIL